MELPEELAAALRRVLAGVAPAQLARATEHLMHSYRGTVATDTPLLRGRAEVAAYAAYRMPATYAAVRSALAALTRLAPGWRPRTHVDVGGGTGAAAWAVADTWPGLGSVTVLDWSAPALALGRELAADSALLGRAEWRAQAVGPGGLGAAADADLVTVSYVLGELADGDREALVGQVAAARAVVLVEPGTPAGFRRIRLAREQLAVAGLHIAAPCPHSAACPLQPGDDWCHFAVRLGRTALHRRIKGGTLGYEDEKFSYVVALREPVPRAAGRVLRHPVKRKGLVELRLCTADGAAPVREVVAKRHGESYRAARDLAWGDAWAPLEGREGR